MNTNKAFLDILDAKTKGEILGSIAEHYGVNNETIYSEVTSPGAEHLLDTWWNRCAARQAYLCSVMA